MNSDCDSDLVYRNWLPIKGLSSST